MKRPLDTIVPWMLLVTAVTATAWAATNAPTSKPAEDPIRSLLQSGNPQKMQQGIEAIWEQLHSADPKAVRSAVRGMVWQHWLDGLVARKRYKDVERLCSAAILAVPSETRWLEELEGFRVRSFLLDGKPNEALSAAKQAFNVCRLEAAAKCLSRLADCLKEAYPNDPTIVQRFRDEQSAGANTQAITSPRTTLGPRSSVLDNIRIDGSAYRKAAEDRTGDEFWNLMSRGNLLLLADRAKEARPVFERAYAIAPDKHLAVATESIARCMKAEDGTIGRANAWVLSIRP